MTFDIADAVLSLCPGAQFVEQGGVLTWLDDTLPRPSDAEIQTEIIRLQDQYEATKYRRERQKNYPPITELADALYWASEGDDSKLTAYYAACAAVKAKYPKPEEVTP